MYEICGHGVSILGVEDSTVVLNKFNKGKITSEYYIKGVVIPAEAGAADQRS
jgi:hypothetical protein